MFPSNPPSEYYHNYQPPQEGDFFYDEDRMGMKITSGSVNIVKDNSNLIGISIGGGAPYCPCIYIVQVSS